MKALPRTQSRLAKILDMLEKRYGKPKPPHPTDPYEMLLYTLCGYPASDAACDKAFPVLKREVGLDPESILAASEGKLAEIMRLGGIVPEVRAKRLKEVAGLVKHVYGGDLRAAMKKTLPEVRRILKQFPTIGDPGADKILLFSNTAPLAAVPSNCIHVPTRLGFGEEKKNYAASYKSAQEALNADLPAERAPRLRAYLLLKRHGQETCKSNRPRCEDCVVSAECIYYQRTRRLPGPGTPIA
jgi:endonuclease III